jgi:hypothetical protein
VCRTRKLDKHDGDGERIWAATGRVLINAQMSGFGGEAEILWSTRALPVLTTGCVKNSYIGEM